ncbi:hypothetical protein BDAP_002674 [Binucleata daphniae]
MKLTFATLCFTSTINREMNIKQIMYYIAYLLLSLTKAEIFDQCNLPSYEGLVVTKYYRETCPHCQRLTPHLTEINNRLESASIKIKVRNVECQKCTNCSKDKIEAVPTVVLTKDGTELGRFRGYREFNDIVDFFVKHIKVDKNLFYSKTKSTVGKVVTLKERNFYSGFDGPWLILFYKKNSDKQRELVKEIASVYNEKLKVGEISEKEAENIAFRFNMGHEPIIIAFYNGLTAEYSGKNDLPSLIDFCDTLINPSLEEISLEKLNRLEEELKPSEPIFIVFYSDLRLANLYFKKPAHEFKYKVKMYKTNDPRLFEKASIYPQHKNTPKNIFDAKDNTEDATKDNNDVKDGDLVILASYRNKMFHRSDADITNIDALYNWIFHAHYPYVTRVTNDNFHTIFHGYKAVVILLTRGDAMIDEFEQLSENRHMGVPFAEQIFAVLDLYTFPVFAKMLFPSNSIPSLVFYNPVDRKFYGNNKKLDKENFFETSINAIKDFEKGKLRQYPFQSHKIRNVLFILICVAVVLAYTLQRKQRAKVD